MASAAAAAAATALPVAPAATAAIHTAPCYCCHSMPLFVLIYACPTFYLGSSRSCSPAFICAHHHSFMLSSPFVCWFLFVLACLSLLGCTGWPSCLSMQVSSFAGHHSMLAPRPLLLPMPLPPPRSSSLPPPLGLHIHTYACSLPFPLFVHSTQSRQSQSFVLCSASFTLAFALRSLFAHTSMFVLPFICSFGFVRAHLVSTCWCVHLCLFARVWAPLSASNTQYTHYN